MKEEETTATIKFEVPQISQINQTLHSPKIWIGGVEWRIKTMPRQHIVQNLGFQRTLGFFLECCAPSYSDNWFCEARAELRLLSQNDDVRPYSKRTNHIYQRREPDWGYSNFMMLNEVFDESKGYIKNDTIQLEAVVKTRHEVKYILSHTQFKKKIEDFIALANFQAHRSFLDKAFEINEFAKNFCGTKDLNCLDDIEAQFEKLTQMKLDDFVKNSCKNNFVEIKEMDNSIIPEKSIESKNDEKKVAIKYFDKSQNLIKNKKERMALKKINSRPRFSNKNVC